jgi:hypothetical protein
MHRRKPCFSVPICTVKQCSTPLKTQRCIRNYLCFPSTYQTSLKRLVPSSLVSNYQWGFNWEAHLPYAYVFVKQKKAYKAARSIISYSGAAMAKLLRATSLVLLEVAKIAYPQTFGNLNNSQVWPSLHKLLSEVPQDTNIHVVNDDLMGFFTSIPQDRIMASVKHCIAKYFSNRPEAAQWQEVCFTAQVSQKQSPGRVFRGKSRRATATPRVIKAGDIYTIVETSFALNIFTVVGRSFKQVRAPV